MSDPAITIDDVHAAAATLSGVATRTPVLTSRTLDRHTAATVLLKCENFQRGGAFKFRGAYTALSALTPQERRRGVVAYSSGNHAQAVALAARELDTTATIVMPTDAPPAKRAATEGYGATVVTYDRYTGNREVIAGELAAETGAALIPPYDHPPVIAGQGTTALELIDDVGDLDVLLAPLGGGGLMAGCATVAAARCAGVRIVGVEPAAGDDHLRSLVAGERVTVAVPSTVADGLAVPTPGTLTFPITSALLDEVVAVGDDAIAAAMTWMFERMKLAVEPSAAAVIAALLDGHINAPGARIGVIISGGNVGAARFAELTARIALRT